MKHLLLPCWDYLSAHFPSLILELNYLRRYHNYENDLWKCHEFCDSKSDVIDVGTNMGIYSRWMGKKARHVHSFECNSMLFPALSKVLPGNSTVHPFALSSKEGETSFRFDPGNTGIGTIESANALDQNEGIKEVVTVQVRVRRLDQFNFDNVSLIKIDVEGHELEVLKGAQQLLQQWHPALMIEIEERHCPGSRMAVPAFLNELGYSPFFLSISGQLTSLRRLDDAPKNINNFWFLTRNRRSN